MRVERVLQTALVAIALVIGLVGGYIAGSRSQNDFTRYCYATGTYASPGDAGGGFTQQYHETCSSQPLPQTP